MSGFRTFLDALTPVLLLQTVCLDAKLDIPPCSTSLHPDYVTLYSLRPRDGHPGGAEAAHIYWQPMLQRCKKAVSKKNDTPGVPSV